MNCVMNIAIWWAALPAKDQQEAWSHVAKNIKVPVTLAQSLPAYTGGLLLIESPLLLGDSYHPTMVQSVLLILSELV